MTAIRQIIVTLALSDVEHVAALVDRGLVVTSLQGDSEPLTAALDQAHHDGVETVRLIPFSRAQVVPDASWVRRVAGHWRREGMADSRPRIFVGTQVLRDFSPLGIEQAARAPFREVTGKEAPLCSPAWTDPPPASHHLLVCRGPRCMARGAEQVAQAVVEQLRRQGLGDDDVLVTQTGCLFPCHRAPVVLQYPEGLWHGPVHVSDIPSLVAAIIASERVPLWADEALN